MWISGFATVVGIGGLLGITLSKYLGDLPAGIGALMTSIKTSWDSKDFANKSLMALTYISLVYLGGEAWMATRDYRKTAAGRLGA